MCFQMITYHDHKKRVKELKSVNTELQIRYDDLQADTEKAENALNEIFHILDSPLFRETKLEKIEKVLKPFFEPENINDNERTTDQNLPIR